MFVLEYWPTKESERDLGLFYLSDLLVGPFWLSGGSVIAQSHVQIFLGIQKYRQLPPSPIVLIVFIIVTGLQLIAQQSLDSSQQFGFKRDDAL